MVSPAYLSSWGPSILSRVSHADHGRHQDADPAGLPFPARAGPRLRTRHALREGQEELGQNADLFSARCKSRYQSHFGGPHGRPAGPLPRFAAETGPNFTEDIYGIADITKLSDQYLLQDFYPGEFQINPQPDNVVAVTKIAPELHADRDRPVPGQRFLRDKPSGFPKWCSMSQELRFSEDRFFTKAKRASPICIGALPAVPAFRITARFGSIPSINFSIRTPISAGFPSCRASVSAALTTMRRAISGKTILRSEPQSVHSRFLLPDPTLAMPLQKGGSTVRTVLNAGVEASFKTFARMGRCAEHARWGSTACGMSSSRSRIFPGFRARTPIRPPSCSSIASSLPPNCPQSIFRNSLPSIRSTAGRSGGLAFATDCKPVETISRSAGWISRLTST